MNGQFYAFGEVLWDCLPSGRHPGGVPFNVASHLAQLGAAAALISSVGDDAPGDEILEVAAARHVNTRFVSRARIGLPTGTVNAALDAAGNATYEIVEPAAWDEILVAPETLAAVSQASALVFGSLAARSPHNREQLDRLLSLSGPGKFFDVNLRPPFVDPARILALAGRADVIKLNDSELGTLAAWLPGARITSAPPAGVAGVAHACAAISKATGVARICVTLGAAGAALWDQNAQFIHVPAPPTAVRDTVGAGDAFMAGLVIGLTQGAAAETVLECACRLGAYVASQPGATPLLPGGMIAEIASKFHL